LSDEDQKAGKTSGAVSRAGILTLFFGDEEEQISLERLRTRLSESLDAEQVKAFKLNEVVYTPRGREIKGEFVIYSDPLVDHRTRLAAQKMCFELLDAFPSQKPSQKHEHEHVLKGTVNLEARLNEAMRRKAKHGESSSKDKT
jgi:hypothetical protein